MTQHSPTALDLKTAQTITKLALAFSRIERVTKHEDGVRPETDSDHTVMLAWMAAELAPAWLNRDRVAAYAVIHDLPETHAGDKQTLRISDAGRAEKQAAEAAARMRFGCEIGFSSWTYQKMLSYEAQGVSEARYVRLFDKILPKLTHALNGCIAVQNLGLDRAALHERDRVQYAERAAEYPEFPETLALLRAAMDASEAAWIDRPSSAPPERVKTIDDYIADDEEAAADITFLLRGDKP